MTCRSCQAPIRWATTSTGKPIPLDQEPTTEGNVVLIHIHGQPDDDLRAVIYPRQIPLIDEPTRYTIHHATCPNRS